MALFCFDCGGTFAVPPGLVRRRRFCPECLAKHTKAGIERREVTRRYTDLGPPMPAALFLRTIEETAQALHLTVSQASRAERAALVKLRQWREETHVKVSDIQWPDAADHLAALEDELDVWMTHARQLEAAGATEEAQEILEEVRTLREELTRAAEAMEAGKQL